MANRLEELLPLLARLSESGGEFKSLADLSAEDGRSSFHLQRVFRAEVGESPLQFSRRVRLQRAAAALLVTDKTVLEIALDAGFESHEGFTRAFRARFDVSPTQFREQREVFQRLVRQYQTHWEIANRTAPCVGLFRVSTAEKSKSTKPTGGPELSYEIEKRTIAEMPFLHMRRQTKPEEIAEALGNMFGPVFEYATSNGIPFGGPPTARYVSFGPGLITLEAGMPIAGPAAAKDDILLGALTGGEVVTTVHKGPYDTLNLAHEAIQSWVAENKLEIGGAPWEVYLTDPGEVPNPEDWLTEVNWPLKA